MINRKRILMSMLAALMALSLSGCRRRLGVDTDEEPARIASVLHVYNPRTQRQLLSGFYGIESRAWRWTAGKFAVVLRPPVGASAKGATLKLTLVIPDPVIQKLGNITLSAKAGDVSLPPETYARTGDFTYSREVPAAALQGDTVRVDFWLNKSIPPGPLDRRELGIIVKAVGIDVK